MSDLRSMLPSGIALNPHVLHWLADIVKMVTPARLHVLDGEGLTWVEEPTLAHDYAGHFWGPESWEVLDLTLRLDAALGRLFDTLDQRFGKTGWAVVLTSDHGATPMVDYSDRSIRLRA